MARSTMATLITRVRTLIGDLSSSQYTDDQVQAALDQRRTQHTNRVLDYDQKVNPPGSATTYVEFFSAYKFWEEDEEIRQSNGTVVTPDADDELAGYWHFASSQTPPLYINGKTYDVYAAAADLLEEWAATKKLEFDFQDGASAIGRKGADLTQPFRQMLELAALYRKKSLPRAILSVRDDINPNVR
jgi:hypothetical protein